MIVVWKFELDFGTNSIYMPAGAKVLHANEQNGVPHIWALVDPDEPKVATRLFVVLGTGHKTSFHQDDLKYISTLFTEDHTFVFHVFEYDPSPYHSPAIANSNHADSEPKINQQHAANGRN